MRRLLPLLLGLAALTLVSASAYAVPAARGRAARQATRSVGYPFAGRLTQGVLVRESETLRYTPEYAPGGHFYGTPEMAQLLARAGHHVARRHPGVKLSIGELSRAGGGPIPGHHSHQNGRDVDLSFYMLDGRGNPFAPWAFANFDDNGRGEGVNVGLRFDDARNWELVSKLVTDPEARVQYIFVGNGLKRRLLAEGRRVRSSPSVLDRAERVMVQPSGNHPHRNHFHVRIYCTGRNGGACLDRAPFHPWAPRR